MSRAWESLQSPPQPVEREQRPGEGARSLASPSPRRSEGDFLRDIYADVLTTYREKAKAGYIDLSNEPTFHRSFADGLSALGSAPDHVEEVRTRAAPLSRDLVEPYEPRL